MKTALMFPLLGHFGLVVVLYVWLTFARMAAVRARHAELGDFALADGDPKASARIQRNLANQFEAPLFVYFATMYLIASDVVGGIDVVAAWIFLVGRVLHSGVQTLTDNVRLRGQVFTINFIGILMLMAHVAWHVLMDGSR